MNDNMSRVEGILIGDSTVTPLSRVEVLLMNLLGNIIGEQEVRSIVSEAIAEVIDSSADAFDILNDLEDWLETHEEAFTSITESIASSYDSTHVYSEGDYCTHNYKLYKCINTMSQAEAWTDAHWSQVNVIEELKNSITSESIAPEFSTSASYTAGQMVLKNGVLYKFTSAHSGAWTGTDAAVVTVGGEIKSTKEDKIPFPVSPYLKYGLSGQLLRTKGNGNTEWVDSGLPTDEQTAEAISAWLDEHPEATTTVQDGSLTEVKFSNALKLKSINAYVTPEMYGAVGDGVTDDSVAIQKMLDEAPLDSVCVMLKDYYCASGLLVTRAINVYMYGKCIFSNTLEYGFRVYGRGARRNTFRLNLVTSDVQDTWRNRSIIGLDMWACQENTFDIYLENFKTGVRLLAGNTTNETDCDYNKIFIRRIYNCQYAIYLDGLTGEGSLSGGTVSQNTFIGGRVGVQGASYTWLGQEDTHDNCYWAVRSDLKAGRTNNNNTFLAVSFEGFGVKSSPYENRARVTLDFAFCMYLNCRYEGMTEITKTVSGVIQSYVIGGYGADDIYDKNNMFIGNKKINLTPYQNPLVLQRIGSGNRYLEIKAVNGIMIAVVEDKYFYLPTIVLLPDGKPYGSVTVANSMKLLYEYYYGSPHTSMEHMGNGEWRVTNFGHIVSKNRAGNTTFDIQPIYTAYPTFQTIETGTMVFKDGRPQWYDGAKWVYADGTAVT